MSPKRPQADKTVVMLLDKPVVMCSAYLSTIGQVNLNVLAGYPFSDGWEKAVIGSAAKQSRPLSIQIAPSFHSSQ